METVRTAWFFFQDQVLGMKWLNELIGRGLTALGLDTDSTWGGILRFFLYDTIKIFVLLSVLIFAISYIQSYFPPERTRRILGRFRGLWANALAALLGTVTPFCSCSSIPLFMGFTSAGLPIGVTFSFLISSPMVDLGSLVLLMSIFGGRVAVVYVVLGLVIAVIGGTLLGIKDHADVGRAFACFCLVLGRLYPVFYEFRGSHASLALVVGAFAVNTSAGGAALVVLVAVTCLTRYLSLATVAEAIVLIMVAVLIIDDAMLMRLLIFSAVLVIFKHIPAMIRLMQGKEFRYSLEEDITYKLDERF